MPGDSEKNHRGEGKKNCQLKDLIEPGVEKTLDLVHIIIQHRHRFTHPVIFKEFYFTGLDVIVGILSQGMLNMLGEVHETMLIGPLKKTFETKNDHSQNS